MNILVNDGISIKGIEKLEKAGFQVLQVRVAQNQLANFINQNNVEVLLIRSATQVNKTLIDSCPSLRIIARAGVGTDNIDVDYARQKGLLVLNTPGASSRAVAELVFAHLLSGVRSLQSANRNLPLEGDSHFKSLKKLYSANSQELQGKTLGIIGFGRIGKAVAKIAFGMGMNVIATSPKDEETKVRLDFFDGRSIDFDVAIKSLTEVVSESDFITLHVPAQPRAIIGEKEMALMKVGVGIINTSRGGVIDENALLENLETGKIGFAGLDVFNNEPTPSIAVLMNDKISLSPHIGGSTIEAQDRIAIEIANQIISHVNAG